MSVTMAGEKLTPRGEGRVVGLALFLAFVTGAGAATWVLCPDVCPTKSARERRGTDHPVYADQRISEPVIAAPEERYVGSLLTHVVTVVFLHFRWLLRISTMLTWSSLWRG